jgi:formylglycine-generating enzyme required for sulfatase activity
MKKKLFLIILTCLILKLSAQSDKELQNKINKFTKSYPAWVYIPERSFKTPDLVINEGGFLIFKTEVSNLDWKEFVDYTIKQKGKEAADAMLPDSLLWLNLEKYADFVAYYYGRTNYSYFPVVNISYVQAEAYCKWLEDFYNSRENKFYKKVTVSLPTEKEWMYAAMSGNQQAVFSWPGYSVYGSKNEFQGNFYALNQANVIYGEGQLLQIGEKLSAYNWLNPGENSPAQASSFKPNAYGLYNMSGNVAEFVKAEAGAYYFTKGGSWGDPGYYLQIITKQACDVKNSASPFRGFRPILKMEF